MFTSLSKLIGSTTRQVITSTQRMARVDDDGYLEVTIVATATQDVNVLEIAGNAVAGVGVNGMLGVGGDVADDAAASASHPVKVGAVADEVVSLVADGDQVHFVTDLYRRLRTVVDNAVDAVVRGDVADDAPASISNPVKAGAVADGVVSLVTDGDQVHLVTDLYRRLRVAIDEVVATNISQVGGTTVVSGGVAGMLTVAGDVADDAVASASYPVKVGAVADNVVALVADGDQVHLVTDLYRRLRNVSAAYDTTNAADQVVGSVAAGAASISKPVEIGGADQSNLVRTLFTDESGRLRVIGSVADDAAAGTEHPVKIGAVADNVVAAVADGDQVHLVTDLYRRLRAVVDNLVTVAGDVADDAAATVTAPLKVGAVADNVVSAVTDADMVHLVTDLYRRLRTVSAAYDTVNEADQVVGAAADGGTPTGKPVEIGGVDQNALLQTLFTDELGRLRVVGSDLDDAVATASPPVKVGAVADEVVTAVADGDQVHLITDLYRRLRNVSAAFDTLTESDKVAVQNTIASDRDYTAQTVADVTDQAAATINYPSDDGFEIGNRPQLFFAMTLLDVTSVGFEVSNDRVTWIDQTEDVVESGTALHPITYFTAAAVDVTFAPRWTCGWRYIRCAVTTPDATNTVEIDVLARALA